MPFILYLSTPNRSKLRWKRGKRNFYMKTFGEEWKNNSFELPIAVTWKQMLRYKNMRGRTELYTVHDEF